MKLTLDNIGPLKHAEIDLSKDLIILCGPNNTGKTYAAYTAYGCYRLHDLNTPISFQTKLSGIEENIEELRKTGNTIIDLFKCYTENKLNIQADYSQLLVKKLPEIFDSSDDFFSKSEITLLFDDAITNRKIFEDGFSLNSYAVSNNLNIRATKYNDDYNIHYALFDPSSYNGSSNLLQMPSDAEFELKLRKWVCLNIIENLMYTLFKRPHIAPAERIAINLFNKSILLNRSKLVDEALRTVNEDRRNLNNIFSNQKLFSLPIRDNLEIANNLEQIQKRIPLYEFLALDFEREILGGKISVSQYGELLYTPDNINLSMNVDLSASMVKSLASLVFYFRHIAQKGDFIIIDEPELNLHPDNQRKVAKLLARIVNAGFKVMISTHSDYIYRELNNQIMLNQDSDEARAMAAKYGYKKEEILDHNKVGAYLFLPTETKSLPVNATGFEVKTIDDAIGGLNDASIEIYTSLF